MSTNHFLILTLLSFDSHAELVATVLAAQLYVVTADVHRRAGKRFASQQNSSGSRSFNIQERVYWFYTYAGLVAQWDSGSPLNKWCAPRLEGCSRVKEDGGKDSKERTNLKKSESMRLGEDCL